MGRDTPKYVTPDIQNKNTDPAGQDLMPISSSFRGEVLSNFVRPIWDEGLVGFFGETVGLILHGRTSGGGVV